MPRSIALPWLAAALLAGCGSGREGPRWVELARGFRPPPLLEQVQQWHAAAGLDPGRVSEMLEGVRVEHELARSDWTAEAEPGLWSAALPGGAFPYGLPGFLNVSVSGSRLDQHGEGTRALHSFSLVGERLRLHLPPGEEPAASMLLSQRLEQGRATQDGSWQLRIGPECGAGIPVWSGMDATLLCDVPAGSRLSYLARWTSRARPDPVTFRVRLDGALVEEFRLMPDEHAAGKFRSVSLPAAGRQGARLSFEVAGPKGLGIFFRPVLGPDAIGSYGERPWSDGRPDLLVFLADTFRADNLARYGGDPELAPNLNRFAERSLCFQEARSTAAWTLPSISSLLTGLAPGQHTANDTDRALPPEIVTVVESLSRAGYRTGAITDAGFFSPYFGLDQGFETFLERNAPVWNLRATIGQALEFLARDDGRPVFLVVHTYRVHLPYRVGGEEDRAPWEALVVSHPMFGHVPAADQKGRIERIAAGSPLYRDLYHQGVRALDAGFGDFLSAVERLGLLEQGFLFFLSDHGEALGENRDIFHGGDLWDVKLKIPLLVHGPGLAPRAVQEPVTLLDVAPTLAALAGLPADVDWIGQSLFSVSTERPSYAFRLQEHRQVALVDEDRKLLTRTPETLSSGACDQAYDLAGDPLEERNLAGQAPWPAELARLHAERMRQMLEPMAGSTGALISAQQRRELDALGYGGDDESDG